MNKEMSTGRELMIRLVRSVKKHSCLWDPSNEHYSRRSVMEQAWKEISEEVGRSSKFYRCSCIPFYITYCMKFIISELTCKGKWRSVRTGFLRSLKDTGATKKLFYMHDAMQFLVPFSKRTEQIHLSSQGSSFINIKEEFQDDLLERVSFDSSYSEASHANEEYSSERSTKKFKQEIYSDTETINNQDTGQSPEEEFLMSFFKGISPDVLSLSSKNQRLFKRKLVELVDDLHDEEEWS